MRSNTLSVLTGFAGTLAVVSALAVAPASAAGPTSPSDGGQAQDQSPQENCQARPGSKKDDRAGSATKKLGKCGGVLLPPEINDPGLVKPAPDAGAMPVIKPGQVPEQVGMSLPGKAGPGKRQLVDRGGRDAVDEACLRIANRPADDVVRGAPGFRRQGAGHERRVGRRTVDHRIARVEDA